MPGEAIHHGDAESTESQEDPEPTLVPPRSLPIRRSSTEMALWSRRFIARSPLPARGTTGQRVVIGLLAVFAGIGIATTEGARIPEPQKLLRP